MKFIICDLEKSYVKGHYILRNGRRYWVKPYMDNRKKNTVKPVSLTSMKKPSNSASYKNKDNDKGDYNKHPDHYVNVSGDKASESKNFILQFALNTAQDIQKFDAGEKSNYDGVLKNCKTIVSKLGYMDDNISHLFKPSEANPEPIGPNRVKKVRGIHKEAKKIYLRVNDSGLKQHISDIIQNTKI
jgi:hypothetical protein